MLFIFTVLGSHCYCPSFLSVLVVLNICVPIPSRLEFFVFEKFILFTAKMLEGVDSKKSICKLKNLFFSKA